MTLEELKKEADALGYRLVKKSVPYETLLPCTCGCKRREHWGQYLGNGKYRISLVCMKCGHIAAGRTLAEARRTWNKEIRELNDKAGS